MCSESILLETIRKSLTFFGQTFQKILRILLVLKFTPYKNYRNYFSLTWSGPVQRLGGCAARSPRGWTGLLARLCGTRSKPSPSPRRPWGGADLPSVPRLGRAGWRGRAAGSRVYHTRELRQGLAAPPCARRRAVPDGPRKLEAYRINQPSPHLIYRAKWPPRIRRRRDYLSVAGHPASPSSAVTCIGWLRHGAAGAAAGDTPPRPRQPPRAHLVIEALRNRRDGLIATSLQLQPPVLR